MAFSMSRMSTLSLKGSFTGTQQKIETQKARCPVSSRRTTLRVSALVELPSKFSQISPSGNRVFVKADPAEEKTAGGVLLPEAVAEKSTSGTVLSAGAGCKELKEGDQVYYSKFGIGITKINFKDEEHLLMTEVDVIGSTAVGGDIPELQPCGDRVLVKPMKAADKTTGGVLMVESARDKPMTGEVLAAGPGTPDNPMKVAKGDKVVYFKYAGDKMKAKDGKLYVVLRQNDIFGKLN